jgi:predicted metal-dependent HD superfamily phosphohydrolase
MDRQFLANAWQYLIAGRPEARGDIVGTGERLLDRWSDPQRRYHDLVHLGTVLGHLAVLAEHAFDPDAVRIAAWYHDAVYEARRDDEERSAKLAEQELGRAGLRLDPALVAEVGRIVRVTATHDPTPGDRNAEALCDADLAVLAGSPGRYAAYVSAVRAEYAHLSDSTFRVGRAKVLQSLLDGPSLFRTPHGQQNWEVPARANIALELVNLEAAEEPAPEEGSG